jgi:hypothetical protein
MTPHDLPKILNLYVVPKRHPESVVLIYIAITVATVQHITVVTVRHGDRAHNKISQYLPNPKILLTRCTILHCASSADREST